VNVDLERTLRAARIEWTDVQRGGNVTIHKDKKVRKPYVLLADVPMPDRAILLVWLVGMEVPPLPDAVYLDDYLRFVRERKRRSQTERLE
jgi:hypothetical protein